MTVIDDKKRKKWDAHITACKLYLRHRGNIPDEKKRFEFHWESEIAIDDHLRELEEELKRLKSGNL